MSVSVSHFISNLPAADDDMMAFPGGRAKSFSDSRQMQLFCAISGAHPQQILRRRLLRQTIEEDQTRRMVISA
jgi:hypothetical protein